MWRSLKKYLKRLQAPENDPGIRSTIENIPTAQFNALLDGMCAEGWRKKNEYDGFDAWIDYGHVELRKGNVTLTFEWTNWFEGSINGPTDLIDALAETNGLKVVGGAQPGEEEDAP